MMGAALKVLIGLILIIVGLGLFVDEVSPIVSQYSGIPSVAWLSNFLTVVTGVIPVFLILIGLFVVWLELDEMKMQRELAKESQKGTPAEPAKAEEKAEKPAEKTEKKKK